MGAPTVLIGEVAGGGGGGGGGGAPGIPGMPGNSGSAAAKATESQDQAGVAMQNSPPGQPEYGKMNDVELQAQTLQNASDTGAPFCEACEKARRDAVDNADRVRDEAKEAQRRAEEEKRRGGYYDGAMTEEGIEQG